MHLSVSNDSFAFVHSLYIHDNLLFKAAVSKQKQYKQNEQINFTKYLLAFNFNPIVRRVVSLSNYVKVK